jgi:hypothetical protein
VRQRELCKRSSSLLLFRHCQVFENNLTANFGPPPLRALPKKGSKKKDVEPADASPQGLAKRLVGMVTLRVDETVRSDFFPVTVFRSIYACRVTALQRVTKIRCFDTDW